MYIRRYIENLVPLVVQPVTAQGYKRSRQKREDTKVADQTQPSMLHRAFISLFFSHSLRANALCIPLTTLFRVTKLGSPSRTFGGPSIKPLHQLIISVGG